MKKEVSNLKKLALDVHTLQRQINELTKKQAPLRKQVYDYVMRGHKGNHIINLPPAEMLSEVRKDINNSRFAPAIEELLAQIQTVGAEIPSLVARHAASKERLAAAIQEIGPTLQQKGGELWATYEAGLLSAIMPFCATENQAKDIIRGLPGMDSLERAIYAWSRPGQPEDKANALLTLAGRLDLSV